MVDRPGATSSRLKKLGQTGGLKSLSKSAPAAEPAPTIAEEVSEAWSPPPLRSVEDTGLNMLQLADLVLKILYYNGVLVGSEVAEIIRLPYQNVLDPVMEFLKREKFVEISGGGQLGPSSYRYKLGEKGTGKAREALEKSAYAGPAPVPIETYVDAMHKQNDRNKTVNEKLLKRVLENLVVGEDMLDKIGPAINSKRSIFLYGPPGNGKTTLSEKIGRLVLGDDRFSP
ncbi:MAG: hypothetical protein AAF787_07155 [Chloroflexota bacterium]